MSPVGLLLLAAFAVLLVWNGSGWAYVAAGSLVVVLALSVLVPVEPDAVLQ